jgi:hypothetical protein
MQFVHQTGINGEMIAIKGQHKGDVDLTVIPPAIHAVIGTTVVHQATGPLPPPLPVTYAPVTYGPLVTTTPPPPPPITYGPVTYVPHGVAGVATLAAPEINAGSATTAILLLAGCIAVLTGRMAKRVGT